MDIISQAGPPFELDGSVTLAGMGWALQQRQQKERNPGLEEGRNWEKKNNREQQLLAAYTVPLQLELLRKEQHVICKDIPP